MTFPYAPALHAPVDVHVTGRRVVATIVDGLLFSAVSETLTRFLHLTWFSTGAGHTFLVLLAVLYYVVFEGLYGRTVGKLVTGIRVIDAATGGRPGLLSGVSRTALRLVDGFFGYLVALIVVVNSTNRRRLGDMAAKTLVVRANSA
jgi:uncharacterized RDD family membrane protein YckC